MPLGRKVADIYAELNLDKDTLRQAMAAAGGEMGADADRLGKQLGDRMSKGMAGQVEQLSARLAKARLAEQKATDAVALAQSRLTEAEGKGNVEGSRLLALQQKLSQSEAALAIAHDNTAKATTRHADAEKRLAADIENLAKTSGPAADRVGRDTGDKLSQGIHLAIIRNSPLIAAGVGAALAFGAPVAFAGATALFAGIGIAAAVQSDQVKSAWEGTWHNVTDTLKAESGPMQSELTHLAGVTNSAFRGMSEDIGAAINDSAPLVDRLATSVLNAADNALPGLTKAVHEAGPAVDGLGHLVEDTGTGVGKFFENIAAHSPAAGQAFTSLGQIVGTVLPLLGTMLGQGAELASIVLPPLARILDVVAGALEHVAPLLPLVGAGFTSWKIISTVTGWLDGLSGRLEKTAASGGIFSGAADKAKGAVGGLATALPILGVILAAGTAAYSAYTQQVDTWANALVQGGSAANTARGQMANLGGELDRMNPVSRSVADAFGATAEANLLGAKAASDATEKYHEQLAAMDPVTRAQTLEKQALNDLNFALEKHGEGSASAEVAERKYKDATDRTAEAQAKEELAIHGVTQAMLDQVDQARAGIDSLFAMQHAQEGQRQAEAELQQVMANGKSTTADVVTAQNHYAEALYGTAQATAQYAADQSGLKKDSLEYKQFLDSQLLVSLQQMSTTLTGPAKDAVDRFITTLQQAGVTTDGVGKSADTTGQKLDNLGTKNPKPTIGPAADNVTPQVDNLMNSLFDLGQAHPVPQADLDTKPAERNKDVMIGMLDNLGIQHPTPTADLNLGPFSANSLNALAQMGNLQAQHPTPTSFLNTGPLQTSTSFALGQLYNLGNTNPTSTANLRDNASGALSSIRGYLNSLDGRVVTTYVNTIGRSVLAGGGNVGRAVGRRYDVGGKIRGPGGPTDDLIQAVTNTGDPLRVSNEEWLIEGRSSKKYGDLKMAAINAGTATVSLPASGRGHTDGSSRPGSSGSGGGSTITVQNLNVTLQGVWDLSDARQLRQVGTVLRDQIVKLEREVR